MDDPVHLQAGHRTSTLTPTDNRRWDCTSADPNKHWTSQIETYCLNDFLSVLSAIPAGAQVVDPATVATAWGRVPGGGCMNAVRPARLLDTRVSGGPLVAGGTRVVGVTGSSVPPGAAAAVLNVVATQTAAPGYVTVWPAGQPRPLASNVNVDRTGETIAGSVTVPLSGAGSVAIYASMTTHLIVDVMGWVAPGCGFTPLTPWRVLDTRSGAKPGHNAQVSAGLAVGGVPANASAVAVNVTVVAASAPGYVTVWPTGQARPGTSNLNVERVGQQIANVALVGVGSGDRISLFTSGGAHLIVDVAGYWTAGSSLTAVTPTRVLDTRPTSRVGYSGLKPAAYAVVKVNVAQMLGKAPGTLRAVVANLTATQPTGAGFVTVLGLGPADPPDVEPQHRPRRPDHPQPGPHPGRRRRGHQPLLQPVHPLHPRHHRYHLTLPAESGWRVAGEQWRHGDAGISRSIRSSSTSAPSSWSRRPPSRPW